MRRISKITSRQEVEVEERRERLRNMRWSRRRSEIRTITWCTVVPTTLAIGGWQESLLHFLGRLIGIG